MHRASTGKILLVAVLMGIGLAFFAARADAHFRPGKHNAIHAINEAWCGKANLSCVEGRYAIKIMICEASWYWHRNIPTHAKNGQYLGMFQMGSTERRIYGHGPDPWSQAKAAWRYWDEAGWRPWECVLYV